MIPQIFGDFMTHKLGTSSGHSRIQGHGMAHRPWKCGSEPTPSLSATEKDSIDKK